MQNKIILKLFQCLIIHVTTSVTEIKKIISATLNVLENIHELQLSYEKISGKFPHAEIKLFQMDVDKT